jgi:hypothetical protein
VTELAARTPSKFELPSPTLAVGVEDGVCVEELSDVHGTPLMDRLARWRVCELTVRTGGLRYFLGRSVVLALAGGVPARECQALRSVLHVMNRPAVCALARLLRTWEGAAVGHLLSHRTIIFTITVRIVAGIRSAFRRGLTVMNGFAVGAVAGLLAVKKRATGRHRRILSRREDGTPLGGKTPAAPIIPAT